MGQKEVMPLRLPDAAYRMIDELIASGLWGDTRSEVARSLVLDALKRISAAGRK